MASASLEKFQKINKSIRLIRKGCANRPFYHIVVQKVTDTPDGPVIEQVGSYDPMPNIQNEKLTALNFQRIQHWLAAGANISSPVAQLLGLAGFLPIHPNTVIAAWKQRKEIPKERKVEVILGVAPPPQNPKLL